MSVTFVPVATQSTSRARRRTKSELCVPSSNPAMAGCTGAGGVVPPTTRPTACSSTARPSAMAGKPAASITSPGRKFTGCFVSTFRPRLPSRRKNIVSDSRRVTTPLVRTRRCRSAPGENPSSRPTGTTGWANASAGAGRVTTISANDGTRNEGSTTGPCLLTFTAATPRRRTSASTSDSRSGWSEWLTSTRKFPPDIPRSRAMKSGGSSTAAARTTPSISSHWLSAVPDASR